MAWINTKINNSDYHYYISKNNKPNLLSLHGFGTTAETSLHYVKSLEDKYNLIIPELPGHGYLQNIQTDQYKEIDQIIEYLKPLLIELDLKSNFFLIGRSVGGVIGLRLLEKDWFKPLRTVIVQSPVVGYDQGITPTLKVCLKIIPMIKPTILVGVFKTISRFSKYFGYKINSDEVNQLEVFDLYLIKKVVENMERVPILPTENILYIFGGDDIYLTELNTTVARETGTFEFDASVKHFGELASVSINNTIADFFIG